MAQAARHELWSQLRPYRRRFPESRWTQPPAWHLTLLFLGAVRPPDVRPLEQLSEAVARRSDGPFRVEAITGGGRVERGMGVAWLGVDEGAARIIGMADALLRACPPGITTGGDPKRTPSAHLTIARNARPATIAAVRDQSYGDLGVTWVVASLALMRSHLEPGGARYETLHRSAL